MSDYNFKNVKNDLILGKPGCGKTYLAKKMVSNLLHESKEGMEIEIKKMKGEEQMNKYNLENIKNAFIHGKAGCGKTHLTKQIVSKLLNESKQVYLCSVINDYQLGEFENLKYITRKVDDPYDEWIKAITRILDSINIYNNDEAWLVIDDLNDCDRIKDIIKIVLNKNINLLIISQCEPNDTVKKYFKENEIINPIRY